MSSVSGRQSTSMPSSSAMVYVGSFARYAYGLLMSMYPMRGALDAKGSNALIACSHQAARSRSRVGGGLTGAGAASGVRIGDVGTFTVEPSAINRADAYGTASTVRAASQATSAGSLAPFMTIATIAGSVAPRKTTSVAAIRNPSVQRTRPSHFGVRMNGLRDVTSPSSTALPTMYESESPASAAA